MMPSIIPTGPYSEVYILKSDVSNNAFSYQTRKELLGTEPYLRVAPLVEVTPEVCFLKEGKEPAFEEVEDGEIISCKGLKNFLRMYHPLTKAPITIVDNHNHALYFWLEAFREGCFPLGAPLIHVDQHKDMRDPKSRLSQTIIASPQKSWDFVMHQVHVGSFIMPALKYGLISENIILDGDARFASFDPKEYKKTSFILDIDLDVFAHDLAYMDRDRMRETIKQLFAEASCITIATSPYFIPFEEAKYWLEILLEDAGLPGR